MTFLSVGVEWCTIRECAYSVTMTQPFWFSSRWKYDYLQEPCILTWSFGLCIVLLKFGKVCSFYIGSHRDFFGKLLDCWFSVWNPRFRFSPAVYFWGFIANEIKVGLVWWWCSYFLSTCPHRSRQRRKMAHHCRSHSSIVRKILLGRYFYESYSCDCFYFQFECLFQKLSLNLSV